MSALELWRILVRHWWVILLVALLAAGSALVYSRAQPLTYRAQAEVVVLPTRADWGLSMYLEARMRTFRAVLLSPPLAQAALEQTGSDLPPDDLIGRTHVQLDPEEGRIVIEVDDGDPVQAAALANALAGLLQEWVDALNESQVGIDHIYVVVLSPARVPGAPAGPRTMINTLAGAVLGALLGLPLAFLWDFLNGGLRDAERVAAQLGIAVWPVLPPFPADSVPLLHKPEGKLAVAFQRLYTHLRFAGVGEQPAPSWCTLVVLGAHRGDLPSAMLADLGVAIAQDGSTVLLVDADFGRPALHEPLAMSPEPSLGAFLRRGGTGGLKPAETDQAGLYLLPGGEPLSPGSQACVLRRAARALPTLAQAAEVVLVRLPPALESPEGLFVAAQADAVLVVAQAGRTRLRDVQRTLTALRQARASVLGLALWSTRKPR